MQTYSFRKNLDYMLKAFYKPSAVINFFLLENSLPYIIFPFMLFTTLFEISYILDYLNNAPSFFHFLGNILHIPTNQWNFYQIFLVPIVNISDFILLGIVIYLLARIIRVENLDFDPEKRTLPIPRELKSALVRNARASSVWHKLPPSQRKELLLYLNSLKSKEALEHNVEKTIKILLKQK